MIFLYRKAKSKLILRLQIIYFFYMRSPLFESYVRQSKKINFKLFKKVKACSISGRDSYLDPYVMKDTPKILWIYWHDGEISAPYLVRKCIDSWRKRNSNWDIRVLDKSNYTHHVQPITINKNLPLRIFANILRLKLLEKHGGVWTDATTYCHRTLDSWLPYQAAQGFFVFRNPNEDRDIENWFIASTAHHPLTQNWLQRTEAYFEKLPIKPPAYFVHFYLFQWLLKKDKQLNQQFRKCSGLNAVPTFFMMSVLNGRQDFEELNKYVSSGLPCSKLSWKDNVSEQGLDRVCALLNQVDP